MVLLGVDYGRRRVGFASGEAPSTLVFPQGSVEVDNVDQALRAVEGKVRELEAGMVIVGMPYGLVSGDGSGEMEQEVRAFVEELRKRIPVTVRTEDERLSTTMAERMKKEAGEAGKKMDADAGAAAIILESFIGREGYPSDNHGKGTR